MQQAGGRRTFSSTPDEGRSSTSRTTGGEEGHIFNIVTSRSGPAPAAARPPASAAHGRNGARRESPRQRCVKRRRADVLLSRRSGSPEDTDLERISLAGPRIRYLRDLFVIESGAQSRLRTLSVLSACEYRGGLTQQRVWPGWRASAVTPSPRARAVPAPPGAPVVMASRRTIRRCFYPEASAERCSAALLPEVDTSRPQVSSVKRKTAPCGAFCVATSRPPWASTIERLIESPMPMPLGLVV